MKNKITAIFASILLITLTLTGCGSSVNDILEEISDEITYTTTVVKSTEENTSESSSVTETTEKETTVTQKTTTVKETTPTTTTVVTEQDKITLSDIPKYSGEAYVEINNNVPTFKDSELTTESYEKYGDLDYLGRCSTAIACIGQDIMPATKRGAIGMVKPTGWHTVKYECISGKYLYNRCHLIAYELTAENANEKNLITGTRYMNIEGMLPFENMVTDYVKETGNHVMYRVTPVFKGDNLVASGVHMEGKSVEDNGDDISFNIYCYNVQPQIKIDYSTGDSKDECKDANTSKKQSNKKSTTSKVSNTNPAQNNYSYNNDTSATYIINVNTGKFHLSSCKYVLKMNGSNKVESNNRDEIIAQGYTPCKYCSP